MIIPDWFIALLWLILLTLGPLMCSMPIAALVLLAANAIAALQSAIRNPQSAIRR